MKRVKVIELVQKHFPGAQRITDQRIQRTLAQEAAAGWHACYVPTCHENHRHIVFVNGEDPMCEVFDSVHDGPATVLPRNLVEYRLGARIDTLAARDQLSRHGLIIQDLSPGTISLTGNCPRLARTANYPKYGLPNRGWLVRRVIPDVLGLSACPKKLRDNRRLQAAIALDQLGIDAVDICDGRNWVHLRPTWTIADRLVREYAT